MTSVHLHLRLTALRLTALHVPALRLTDAVCLTNPVSRSPPVSWLFGLRANPHGLTQIGRGMIVGGGMIVRGGMIVLSLPMTVTGVGMSTARATSLHRLTTDKACQRKLTGAMAKATTGGRIPIPGPDHVW